MGASNNQVSTKLRKTVADSRNGIGQIVAETVKVLEQGNAKPLLQKAGRSLSQVNDAVDLDDGPL